jgi:hypothetical protein
MQSEHHGLRGMYERIERPRGIFSLLTDIGQGACFTFVAPHAAL